MKGCWIGVVCLVLLLMGGLYVDRVMGRSHAPVSQDLDRAAECAKADDWTGAEAFADRARENWEKNWHFSAAFADHEPMENIDALFSRLTVFAAAREKEEFGALCRELSRQVKAMGDAHDLKWWNLL